MFSFFRRLVYVTENPHQPLEDIPLVTSSSVPSVNCAAMTKQVPICRSTTNQDTTVGSSNLRQGSVTLPGRSNTPLRKQIR